MAFGGGVAPRLRPDSKARSSTTSTGTCAHGLMGSSKDKKAAVYTPRNKIAVLIFP